MIASSVLRQRGNLALQFEQFLPDRLRLGHRRCSRRIGRWQWLNLYRSSFRRHFSLKPHDTVLYFSEVSHFYTVLPSTGVARSSLLGNYRPASCRISPMQKWTLPRIPDLARIRRASLVIPGRIDQSFHVISRLPSQQEFGLGVVQPGPVKFGFDIHRRQAAG